MEKRLSITLPLLLLLSSCQSYPQNIYDLLPELKAVKSTDITSITLQQDPGFGIDNWTHYYHYNKRETIEEYFNHIISLKGEVPPQSRISVTDGGSKTVLLYTEQNTYSFVYDTQGLIANDKTMFCSYEQIQSFKEDSLSHRFNNPYYDFYKNNVLFKDCCFPSISSFTFEEVTDDIKQEERFDGYYLQGNYGWTKYKYRIQPLTEQYFSITDYSEESEETDIKTNAEKKAQPYWYDSSDNLPVTKTYKILEETDFLLSLLERED